jgi:hypothetical protein
MVKKNEWDLLAFAMALLPALLAQGWFLLSPLNVCASLLVESQDMEKHYLPQV